MEVILKGEADEFETNRARLTSNSKGGKHMQVKDFHGKSVIDSREVAEMVEKQHKNLLRDIAGYIKIMEKSGELKIEPSDFYE